MLLLIGAALLVTLSVVGCVGCGGGGEGAAPNSLETIAKNREVHILTEAINAPFEYGDGTGVQGLGADLGEAIAKELGQPLKWVKSNKGANHLFDVIKEGVTVDFIISSVASDPSRTEVEYSDPYYKTGDVIAHHRKDFGITSLASLSGKKVGVVEGRPADAFMASQTAATGVTIMKYPTIDDALGYLNRTEIDAVVGDEILLNYSVASEGSSFTNVNILNELVNPYSYAVAVRKGDAELLKRINAVIAALDVPALEAKWVGDVRERAKARAEGDRETEALKKAPKSIGVSINKQSGNWSMDRLDGSVIVLSGANGTFQSGYIITDGNHGSCRFNTPVPPGDYTLTFRALGMNARVTIPAEAKSSLAMSVNIANTVGISVR
ncbi:MAG: transporter substrate-binding domain-containing protein [Acidobacteriota bacterium]|nr:transporter substrate-binding domain-containing protein [Acidobacteriota bacterium]